MSGAVLQEIHGIPVGKCGGQLVVAFNILFFGQKLANFFPGGLYRTRQ